MANFSNDSVGRQAAEALCRTRIASGAWINGHMGVDRNGNVIVRFQRPMAPTSATTRSYGGWTESRADDEP
jgi:hypothetical protein